jgi:hypothetical protein
MRVIIAIAMLFFIFKLILKRFGKDQFFSYLKTLRGDYELTKDEQKHIATQRFQQKDRYCYSPLLGNEIIKLYVEVMRELQLQGKWTDKEGFFRPVFNQCEQTAMREMGFILSKKDTSTPEEEIIRIIDEKIPILLPLTFSDKNKLYGADNELWKWRYAYLMEKFDSHSLETFYEEVCELGELNTMHDVIARKIYFQTYQFLAKYNAGYALMCYLHYLSKVPNKSFQYRKISKDMDKLLFRERVQKPKFIQISNQLLDDRDLNKALENTKLLFRITRRKIQLDASAIEDAGLEHAQMADLLGKYLEDETSPETEISSLVDLQTDNYKENSNESSLFKWFEANNFTVNKKEIDNFARERGVFRDRLIQQINETYYDQLDDLLIEEEEDRYTLNKSYYERIDK